MGLKTVRLYYCYDCKAILFNYTEAATIHGSASMYFDANGYYVEADFEVNDREQRSAYCNECGGEINDRIAIPIDIYKKLYNSQSINKEKNKRILYIELENVCSIKPEDVKDLIVEALI